MVHALNSLFKSHGLTATQYFALHVLRASGTRGASCTGIAARLIKAEPDVTRLVDRLERRGWVRRARDRTDRRTVKTWITIEGLGLLQSLDDPVRDLYRRPLAKMTRSDVSGLIAALEKVQEAFKP